MRKRKFYDVLLQQIYADDPWKILCCCIMLNCTCRAQVDRVRGELFERWPTPEKMSRANVGKLSSVIRSLGFYNRRARTLKKMSAHYARGWKEITDLPGIGKYAHDSWKIFVEGRTDVKPDDEVLKRYMSKLNSNDRILSM